LRAIDEAHGADLVEWATEVDGPFLFEDLAFDRHEITLTVAVHGAIASQDHAASVGILCVQRSIAEDPDSPVGMRVEQLPRQLAEIRGAGDALDIPTVEFKRVFGLRFDLGLRLQCRGSGFDLLVLALALGHLLQVLGLVGLGRDRGGGGAAAAAAAAAIAAVMRLAREEAAEAIEEAGLAAVVAAGIAGSRRAAGLGGGFAAGGRCGDARIAAVGLLGSSEAIKEAGTGVVLGTVAAAVTGSRRRRGRGRRGGRWIRRLFRCGVRPGTDRRR